MGQIMKNKNYVKPRNPFVILSAKGLTRKAGKHEKTYKQLRAKLNRMGWDD